LGRVERDLRRGDEDGNHAKCEAGRGVVRAAFVVRAGFGFEAVEGYGVEVASWGFGAGWFCCEGAGLRAFVKALCCSTVWAETTKYSC
jgi:hypothetical protein